MVKYDAPETVAINKYLLHITFLQFFVRALFNYNPENDQLLPCQDIGLSFQYGDIMEVTNHF